MSRNRFLPHEEVLPRIEEQRGPAHEWLMDAIENTSLGRVAIDCGVRDNSVRYWRNRIQQGFVRLNGEWVKPQEQAS